MSTTTIFDTKDGIYIHQSLPNLSAIFKNGSCHPSHNACFPQTPKAIPLPQNLQIDSPHYYAMNIHKDKRQTSFLKCYTRSGNLQCASTARRKKGHTQVVRIFVFLLLSLDDRMLTCDLFLFYSRSLHLRVKRTDSIQELQ